MSAGLVQETQMEKQMGCMAGFLQIFDRHQLLTGKRIYSSAKRLPPATDSSSESELSASPAVSRELGKPQKTRSVPKQSISPEVENPAKSPLPVFEFKEGTRSTWKFSREAPRLSLDSRATVNAKGTLYRTNAPIDGGVEEIEKQRRSTSVIAKLMGLEPPAPSDLQPEKKAELRRSASESRVSRDLFHSRFFDGNNFPQNQHQSNFSTNIPSNAVTSAQSEDSSEYCMCPEPAKSSQNRELGRTRRKSFFDSQDIFPEPKQSLAIYGEIERRLRMRGIHEASNDLETLKQILEALQLKGLLHSGKPPNQPPNQTNFVHDRRFSGNDSPIVLMRPGKSPVSGNRPSPPSSLRSRVGSGRQEIDRSSRNQTKTRSPSPATTRSDAGVKSPAGRKPLNVEIQRKRSDPTEKKRSSPVHSPKLSTKSPRNRKPPAETFRKEVKSVIIPAEDESSSISESSFSTPSQTDTERSKMEEYKEGRSLLERCDKLLLSIAEITTTTTELQPSPVSVLDSSLYETTSSSPSPVMKRSIDFNKEQRIELDSDVWSPEIASTFVDEGSEDSDFVYVSEIFRARSYLTGDSDVFLELERQQILKGKDTSKSSRVQRKLIFDTITEIVDRSKQKSISCASSGSTNPNFQQIWSEFRRIRERDACEEDLFEVICGVLRKDLAGDAFSGWGGCRIEMSEAVLDIERLVFKDLVGEMIRDLASFGGSCSNVLALRRKLVF